MNEISLMMYLLSKKEDTYQIGATKKEILDTLNIKNKNKSIHFQNLLTNLSNYIEPLGFQIRFNPLNSHWFISFDPEQSELISAYPYKSKPSLAATLFCILVYCLKNSGVASIQDIKKLRNKKEINEDLKELSNKGYIILNKDLNQVQLTPLIGYQLDMHKLFIKLALKLKE